jgi:hypothetical protein
MRPVTLSILGGIAIASAVAAVVFLPPADDAGQARLGERLFPDLATRAGDVQAIELQRPDGTIVLRRAGETCSAPRAASAASKKTTAAGTGRQPGRHFDSTRCVFL